MDHLRTLVDLFLHLDKHLAELVADYGTWTYLVLFVIVFCETGLVVTPILPGDSLLFAAGAIAALGSLNPQVLIVILVAAALTGDMVNYHVGKFLGPAILSRKDSRIFRPEHLEKTQRFYARYGGKTIILARFVPIVRTFAPFLAGVGRMPFAQYAAYCAAGAVLWVTIGVYAGYFFGQLPLVNDNFSLVVIAIVAISLLPAAIEFWRLRKHKAAADTGAAVIED